MYIAYAFLLGVQASITQCGEVESASGPIAIRAPPKACPPYAFCAKMLMIAPLTVVSDLSVPVQRTENAELGRAIGSGPQWYLHTKNTGHGYAQMAAVDAADHTNGKMARSLFDSAWVAQSGPDCPSTAQADLHCHLDRERVCSSR